MFAGIVVDPIETPPTAGVAFELRGRLVDAEGNPYPAPKNTTISSAYYDGASYLITAGSYVPIVAGQSEFTLHPTIYRGVKSVKAIVFEIEHYEPNAILSFRVNGPAKYAITVGDGSGVVTAGVADVTVGLLDADGAPVTSAFDIPCNPWVISEQGYYRTPLTRIGSWIIPAGQTQKAFQAEMFKAVPRSRFKIGPQGTGSVQPADTYSDWLRVVPAAAAKVKLDKLPSASYADGGGFQGTDGGYAAGQGWAERSFASPVRVQVQDQYSNAAPVESDTAFSIAHVSGGSLSGTLSATIPAGESVGVLPRVVAGFSGDPNWGLNPYPSALLEVDVTVAGLGTFRGRLRVDSALACLEAYPYVTAAGELRARLPVPGGDIDFRASTRADGKLFFVGHEQNRAGPVLFAVAEPIAAGAPFRVAVYQMGYYYPGVRSQPTPFEIWEAIFVGAVSFTEAGKLQGDFSNYTWESGDKAYVSNGPWLPSGSGSITQYNLYSSGPFNVTGRPSTIQVTLSGTPSLPGIKSGTGFILRRSRISGELSGTIAAGDDLAYRTLQTTLAAGQKLRLAVVANGIVALYPSESTISPASNRRHTLRVKSVNSPVFAGGDPVTIPFDVVDPLTGEIIPAPLQINAAFNLGSYTVGSVVGTVMPGQTGGTAQLRAAGWVVYAQAWPESTYYRVTGPALEIVASPFEISGASWSHAQRRLTKEGAFTSVQKSPTYKNYWLVRLDAGTGVAPGYYRVAEITADYLTLESSITADNSDVVDGSVAGDLFPTYPRKLAISPDPPWRVEAGGKFDVTVRVQTLAGSPDVLAVPSRIRLSWVTTLWPPDTISAWKISGRVLESVISEADLFAGDSEHTFADVRVDRAALSGCIKAEVLSGDRVYAGYSSPMIVSAVDGPLTYPGGYRLQVGTGGLTHARENSPVTGSIELIGFPWVDEDGKLRVRVQRHCVAAGGYPDSVLLTATGAGFAPNLAPGESIRLHATDRVNVVFPPSLADRIRYVASRLNAFGTWETFLIELRLGSISRGVGWLISHDGLPANGPNYGRSYDGRFGLPTFPGVSLQWGISNAEISS